ncbi:MAG: long-chain acyl-CoA synthetase [Lentisphaeria bacterium]
MIPRYKNLLELIEHVFDSYADSPAFTCAGHTLSFRDVDELSMRFASYLHNQLGLEPGDRIALQMPNILQYPIAMYGAIRAGLIVVNTNPLYTSRELKHQLIDSGAKVLVVLSNVAGSAAKIVEDTAVETVIVTDFADLHPSPKRQIINLVVKHVKKMVPKVVFKHSIHFRHLVSSPAQPLKHFHTDENSILALQYTGGTTGVSKGAVLSHGNLASNVWQMICHMPEAFREGREVYVACLPLYHIYAYNLHGMCAFSMGSHNILIPNPRDLASIVSALKNIKMTVFVGINTLYVALGHYAGAKQIDFSELNVSSAGGMALTEDAAALWKTLTGRVVYEGYGLTETSPVLCGNKVTNVLQGTIGLPLPETEIKLIDEQGDEVAPGGVGELCARGPQVMKEYWNRPDETEKVLTKDGWFKTGDMAIFLEHGRYKIVDRKKDMILVSGFNVYPNEIEDVVTLHPGILEAAAVGVSDERSGEAVKLFVVPADPGLSVEDVKNYCRENFTAYKRPKNIIFRDSLPKSNVGKVLRRELRDETS